MELIADGLLIATTMTAAIYCAVLGRRLRRLSSTEDGLGEQIATLNGAVEETREALAAMQDGLSGLRSQTQQAGERVRRDLAEAHRVTERLDTRIEEARSLLDSLYAAEKDFRAATVQAQSPTAPSTASAAPGGAPAPAREQSVAAPAPGSENEAMEEVDYRSLAAAAEASASDQGSDQGADERGEEGALGEADFPPEPTDPPPFALTVGGDTIRYGDAEDDSAQGADVPGIVVAGPDPSAEEALAAVLGAVRGQTAGEETVVSAAPPPPATEGVPSMNGSQPQTKPQAEPEASGLAPGGDESTAGPATAPRLRVKRFGFAR